MTNKFKALKASNHTSNHNVINTLSAAFKDFWRVWPSPMGKKILSLDICMSLQTKEMLNKRPLIIGYERIPAMPRIQSGKYFGIFRRDKGKSHVQFHVGSFDACACFIVILSKLYY